MPACANKLLAETACLEVRLHRALRLVDSHVHLSGIENIENLNAIREHIGAERMGIACIYGPNSANSNAAAFAAKAAFPDRFYVFAALDHSAHSSGGRIASPPLDEQVDMLIRTGADGIKLLETKPDRRTALGIPIDSNYFEPFFALVERLGIPLLWHAADPPEFWDAELTPGWARDHGWGYDHTFVPYEQILGEVENVLDRHPRLRVIFAHFLFLSADLARAEALLDRFDGVHFDLAPGIELFYNLSRSVPASRDFFIRHADRIIFGTDIFGSLTPERAAHRAGIVRCFLETAGEFRVPEGADDILGPPEGGIIRGLDLPQDALDRICALNFERLAGPVPRPLA